MQAFETIYKRHHRRVYSLCLRMVANATEAEDLTQEVFIQLFRKIGSFRGESAFTTWLHRLTVNHVLMHFRKRGVRLEKTTEEGEIGEIHDSTLKQESKHMLSDTRGRYSDLIGAMRKAESKMEPVLESFRDHVLFLKHNLNAKAIASLQGTVPKIEGDVAALIADMEKSIAEANAFINQMNKSGK